VLTSNVVRLLGALVLPSTSKHRALTGSGAIERSRDRRRWLPAVAEPHCPVVIDRVRRGATPTIGSAGTGWSAGLGVLRAKTADIDIGLPLALLASRRSDRVRGLLGRGLTPSGDDVLAGLLLGARPFAAQGLAEAIDAHADSRTTTPSAQFAAARAAR
jgi:hypothetical protein